MSGPTDRLLRRTRLRLTVVTLGLVAALVIGIGVTVAVVGLRALDAGIDRSLQATASAVVAGLGGEVPAGEAGGEVNEHVPAGADTFSLVLGPTGALVANLSATRLVGLPDEAAVAAARRDGADLRTITAGGVSLRLVSLLVRSGDGATGPIVGFVQSAFVLTLHDRQSVELVDGVVLVSVVGLLAAALITLVLAGRALVPIRAAFATERRFVADASHELKTPVAVIRASAEVLEREGLVRAAGRPLVSDVIGESDRLARLVGDLLALASVEATGLSVERGPVDLRAIVTDAVRMMGPLAAARDARLEPVRDAAAGREPLRVSADRDRIVQLLQVLLDNAIRHSPPGGTVGVLLAARGGRAVIEVVDEGPGVPVADRERIFEPFARLPGSRARGETGSGLGLAVARSIVERHGGTVGVDEAPGGGARFTVELPLL